MLVAPCHYTSTLYYLKISTNAQEHQQHKAEHCIPFLDISDVMDLRRVGSLAALTANPSLCEEHWPCPLACCWLLRSLQGNVPIDGPCWEVHGGPGKQPTTMMILLQPWGYSFSSGVCLMADDQVTIAEFIRRSGNMTRDPSRQYVLVWLHFVLITACANQKLSSLLQYCYQGLHPTLP